MKKSILAIIAATLLIVSCSSESETPVSEPERNIDAQQFFDENFKVTRISVKRHAYYFVEYGSRHSPSYRFQLLHDESDCKECFSTFD